jgi:hypothetical protein
MTGKEGNEIPFDDGVDDAALASTDGGGATTDRGLEPCGHAETSPTEAPTEKRRNWSKEEIAEFARHYEGDTDEHKLRAAGDPIARRLIANLGRRSKAPSGPIPERSSSEGGDYVVYSATAGPAPSRKETVVGASVVVAGSDSTTMLLPRRRRTWARAVAALVGPAAWMALGAVVGVAGSRWAKPSAAPVSSVPERALAPSSAPSVAFEPTPAPPARGADAPAPNSNGSVERPGAALRATAPEHRAAAKAQVQAPMKRPVEASERRSDRHDDADDGMEATGY